MMESVDKSNQMLQPYNPTRNSYISFKKVGIHVASKMLLHAFTLHKNSQDNNVYFKIILFLRCRDEDCLRNTSRVTRIFLIQYQREVELQFSIQILISCYKFHRLKKIRAHRRDAVSN